MPTRGDAYPSQAERNAWSHDTRWKIDVVLPTQYLRGADSSVGDPHKRLMAAVLQTVVDDCRGSAYRRARGYRTAIARRVVRKATAYMASADRTWPFSFENLCEALGLDASQLRTQLQTIPASAWPPVGSDGGRPVGERRSGPDANATRGRALPRAYVVGQ